MKRVLKKVQAVCPECGTPVDERNERNGKFYCASHYESTDSSEKYNNDFQIRKYKKYKKIFG